MRNQARCVVLLLCAASCNAIASGISGKITVQKKLVRETVATVYNLRGIAVPDGQPAHRKTNEFDRVAVWLEPKLHAPSPPVTATMRQRDRQFEPPLLIVPTGSTVNFPNSDPIFHNIFSLSRAKSFDLGYYPQGHSRSVKFPRPGIVQVYCHIHPSMYAVVIVTSSPWAESPRPDGTFSWTSIPPGKYTLNVWQKSAGRLRWPVVVPVSGMLHVHISLPEKDLGE
ncbi:MAG TPA: hypothetical protein VF283_02275 [Bryobacteraceae bacterium]